jgi:hypothetical protein
LVWCLERSLNINLITPTVASRAAMPPTLNLVAAIRPFNSI